MKSIIAALKTRPIQYSFAVMLLMQIFISASIIIILVFTEVSVADASTLIEGVGSFVVGTVIAVLMGIGLFLVCLSRLRTFYIIIFNIILFALTLGLMIGIGAAGLPVPPIVLLIIIFVFWQYFLVYGLGYIFYYRFRSVALTLMSNSFWFFSIIIVSISDRLIVTNDLTSQTIANNFGLLWRGPEIVLVVIYLLLSALLLLVDSRFSLGRWQRDLKTKVNIRKRNYLVFAVLIAVALLITTVLAPVFWRARWETSMAERERQREMQAPDQEEERQEPPNIGDNPNEEQNPGGTLPQNSPAGQDVPFAAVRYGESIGDDYLDTDSEQQSDDLAPNFVSAYQTQTPQQPESAPSDTMETDPQYFRSEIYDAFVDGEFTIRRLYDNFDAVSGPEVRGFYSYPNYPRYDNTRELYQTTVILSGQSQLVFSNPETFEVGFLAGRPAPYFFGYYSGVISTSDPNKLRQGDTFYSISNVSQLSRDDAVDKQLLINKSYPDFSDTSDISRPLYGFEYNFRVNRLEDRIGITAADSYYEVVTKVEDFLRNNYEYDPSQDNIGDLVEPIEQPQEDEEPNFTSDLDADLLQDSGTDDTVTIEPPPENDNLTIDEVYEFLLSNPGEEENKGGSTMFAAAFTVLLETVDPQSMPRIVSGFRTSQYDEATDAFIISTQDIHYWNEVFFPDFGWVTIDVLDGVKAENPQQQLSEEEQQEIDEFLEEGEERIEEREDLRDELREDNPFGPDDYNGDEDFDDFDGDPLDPDNNIDPDDFDPPQPPPDPPNLEGLGRALNAMLQFLLRFGILFCCAGLILAIISPPLYKYLRWWWGLNSAKQGGDAEQVTNYYSSFQRFAKYFGLEQKATETNIQYANRYRKELEKIVRRRSEGQERENAINDLEEIGKKISRLAYLNNRVVYSQSIPGNAGKEAAEIVSELADLTIRLKRTDILAATYLRW